MRLDISARVYVCERVHVCMYVCPPCKPKCDVTQGNFSVRDTWQKSRLLGDGQKLLSSVGR